MLKMILPTRYGFDHKGRTKRDSFSERELQALNISMTTRIESETVVARSAGRPVNMEQSRLLNTEEHWWK